MNKPTHTPWYPPRLKRRLNPDFAHLLTPRAADLELHRKGGLDEWDWESWFAYTESCNALDRVMSKVEAELTDLRSAA